MIVVQVGAVKIHVAAAVEVLRQKGKTGSNQFITRIDGLGSSPLGPTTNKPWDWHLKNPQRAFFLLLYKMGPSYGILHLNYFLASLKIWYNWSNTYIQK